MIIDDYFNVLISSANKADIVETLGSAVYVNINNVADFIANELVSGKFIDHPKNLPCIMLPWKYAWFEFIVPQEINKIIFKQSIPNHRIGSFCEYVSLDEAKDQIKGFTALEDLLSKSKNVKWVLFFVIIESMYHHFLKLGTNIILIDDVGNYIDSILMVSEERLNIGKLGENQKKEVSGLLTMYSYIIVYAISFCHCKNVSLVETKDDNIKINKKRIKSGKRPLVKFKILDINPIKKILKSGNKVVQDDIKLPYHIRRGHFKDYRKSSGLFGKYKGIFWWDTTAVGDVNEGVVVKDYNVITEEKK